MGIVCCSTQPPPPLLLISRAPFRQEVPGQHGSLLPTRPQNPAFTKCSLIPELSALRHNDYEGYNRKRGAVGVGTPVLGLPSCRHPQIKTSGSQGPLQLRLFIQNCCGPNPAQCKALSGSVPTGALGFWGCLSLGLFTE